jgi:hypothetical protein
MAPLQRLWSVYDIRMLIMQYLKPSDIVSTTVATDMVEAVLSELKEADKKRYLNVGREIFWNGSIVEDLAKWQVHMAVVGKDLERLRRALEGFRYFKPCLVVVVMNLHESWSSLRLSEPGFGLPELATILENIEDWELYDPDTSPKPGTYVAIEWLPRALGPRTAYFSLGLNTKWAPALLKNEP